jgi:hypothetical protein
MDHLSSLSVLLLRTTRSSTTFKRLAKLAPSGITPIFVSHNSGRESFLTHFRTASQYCDGLRGAFVLYDPDDPHKDLYDVDDGMSF